MYTIVQQLIYSSIYLILTIDGELHIRYEHVCINCLLPAVQDQNPYRSIVYSCHKLLLLPIPACCIYNVFVLSICFTQGTLFMLQRSLHNPLRCSLRISTDLAPSSDVCLALYQLNPSFIMDLITPTPPPPLQPKYSHMHLPIPGSRWKFPWTLKIERDH